MWNEQAGEKTFQHVETKDRWEFGGIPLKCFPKASFDVFLSTHHAESFKSYFKTPGSRYLVIKDIRPLLMQVQSYQSESENSE